MNATLGIASALILAHSLWIWSRRVPLQNLVLAETLVLAATLALACILQGAPHRWSPRADWIVPLAVIPGARLGAEWLCRGLRTSPRYGFFLTGTAALLASLPVGLAFRPPAGHSPAAGPTSPLMWLAVCAWCVVTYMITLPCWFDKRRAA